MTFTIVLSMSCKKTVITPNVNYQKMFNVESIELYDVETDELLGVQTLDLQISINENQIFIFENGSSIIEYNYTEHSIDSTTVNFLIGVDLYFYKSIPNDYDVIKLPSGQPEFYKKFRLSE